MEPVQEQSTDAADRAHGEIDELNERAWSLHGSDPAGMIALAAANAESGRASGYRKGLATALRILAFGNAYLSDYDSSVACANESLLLFREIGDIAGEASALNMLGAVRSWQGQFDESRRLYSLALERARAAGNASAEGAALNGLGYLLRISGEYNRAIEHHGESLRIALARDAREEEAAARFGLGNTLERLGKYHEAIEQYRRCLELADLLGNRHIGGNANGSIATIHQRLGDFSSALAYETKSYRYKEELRDLHGISVSLGNIGVIYHVLGEYADALEAQFRSLEISERLGDRRGESLSLENIGQIYEELGDQTRVLDYYLRSLKISQEIGDTQGVASTNIHIGRYYERSGDAARALLYYFQSLRMHETSGDRYGEVSALDAVGKVYCVTEEYQKAEGYYRRMLDLAREIFDRHGEVKALLGLGAVEGKLGRYQEAIDALDVALRISREMGSSKTIRMAILGLAEAYECTGDIPSSLRCRRMYQECLHEIFNDESKRRVGELIFGFEESIARREAEQAGLSPEDLAEVQEILRRESRATLPAMGERRVEPGSSPMDHSVQVIVRTLGEFQVAIDGRVLDAGDWGRRRARDLFKLLLINHHRTLTIEEIGHNLWGTGRDRPTERLVMNAVSHLRKALSPERRSRTEQSMLKTVDRAYRLELDEGIEVDFLRFRELIVEARHSSSAEGRCARYEEAVELYHGDFLKEDLYEEWSAVERELLKDAYLEALEFLAGEYLRQGRTDSIDMARRILASDNTSERAYEILLLGLVKRGRMGEAGRVLEECGRVFRAELGVDLPERLVGIVGKNQSSVP